MKKVLFILVALAVAFAFSAPAMAAQGLSVELGFAWNFDGAGMGKTILKDGEAGSGSVVGDAILADNAISSAPSKDALGNPLIGSPITSPSEGGQMQGLNTALRVRYDFMNMFFARLGFVYDMQAAGGEQSYSFINNATAAASNPLYLAAVAYYGADADTATAFANLVAGKVTQTWTYGYWAIPVTVGINVPVSDKFNVYAGIGLTYYSGFWQLEMKVPAAYAAYDADGDGDADYTGAATGTAKETVKFKNSGIGFNWTIGASAEVYTATSVFVELDATVAGGMANGSLDTTTGKAALGAEKIYFPVNLSNMLVRFGASYRIPVAI